MLVHKLSVVTQHCAVQINILPGCEVGVESRAQFDQRRDAAPYLDAAGGGVQNARNTFEQCTFPAAVGPDQCYRLASAYGQAHVLQRIELVEHQLALQKLYKVFLDRVRSLCRQIKAHGDVFYFNNG